MTPVRVVAVLFAYVMLASCSPAPTQPVAVAEGTAVLASDVSSDAGETIEALMTETVAPNAESIWTAVSYVITAEGTTETQPETDEDWEALRLSANALLDAATELGDTNRTVGELDPSTTSYQYTPDEIADLLSADAGPWLGYLDDMQESTRLTLQAIELRDLMGLQDFGARINQACEGCHADYWYRPQGMTVPQ